MAQRCLYLCIYLSERKRRATPGHYQLILLRGAFLRAEEIACFDLLRKSAPCVTRGRRRTPLAVLVRCLREANGIVAESCTLSCRRSLHIVTRPPARPLTFTPVSGATVASQHFWLWAFIYCCATRLPERTLPRHDRACVFARPRGHLIRWRGLQAITRV